MVGTTTDPPSLVQKTTGDLVLRVCGSSRDGQIVRMRSQKCSIGSAPRCTLRLRARGVRPVHCLILRGQRGTVARRWSPDTRLNGRAFTDAELCPGDRLGVGPIELEVVHPGRPLEDGEDEALEPCSDEIPELSPDDRRKLDELTTRLRRANHHGRQRIGHLVDQLRAVNREITQLRRQAQQPQTPSVPAVGTGLDSPPAVDESEARRREVEQERHEWQREQARLESDLRRQAEEIEAGRMELETRRGALDEERREWDSQRGQTQQQLRQQAEQLDLRREDIDAREEDLQRQCRQWEAERAATEPESTDVTSALRRFEEPVAQDESDQAPHDFDDTLQHAGTSDLLRDDTLGEFQPGAEEESLAAVETPTVEGPSPDTHDEWLQQPEKEENEEESINDYMVRLMQRVQGASPKPVPETRPAPPPGPPEPPVAQPPPEPVSARPEVEPPPEPVSARPEEPKPAPLTPPKPKPEEMSPRAVAPEKHVGLSAMREVAKLSAQTAIDRHTQRQLRVSQRAKLAMTILGLAVGAALLAMWRWTSAGEFTLYVAGFSFVVALFWGSQFMLLAGRKALGAGRRRRETQNGRQATGGDSPPAD